MTDCSYVIHRTLIINSRYQYLHQFLYVIVFSFDLFFLLLSFEKCEHPCTHMPIRHKFPPSKKIPLCPFPDSPLNNPQKQRLSWCYLLWISFVYSNMESYSRHSFEQSIAWCYVKGSVSTIARVTNYGLLAKCRQLPVFVNKVLLKHTLSFTYCQWHLVHFSGRVEYL